MPLVQKTTLNTSKKVEVVKHWDESKTRLVKAAHTELHDVMVTYSIPSLTDLENVLLNSPSNWRALNMFTQIPPQTDYSSNEQLLAIKSYTNEIDQYLSIDHQSTFIKCRVIAGSPDCGKSFLMNSIIIYAISKGLNVGLSVIQA